MILFAKKRSVLAVGLALAALGQAHAQNATQAPDAEPVHKVVITGSNIKRIDVETTTPVQIMRRDEIARLGVNSVREAIDTLTASTGSLSDIGGSNSFAGGASSASLRNLGKQSTLVLLNSRRVAPYALADYNEVFTNLDSLPLDAVDRIEVLRSGGSAIYGSDAVAGVINIITRSDYHGIEAKVSNDQSLKNSVFHERTASLTGGFGDLATDKYNILANVELYKRGAVNWRQVVDDMNPSYGNWFSTVKPGSGLMFGNRGTPSTFSWPGNLIGQGALPGCTTKNSAGLCVYDRFSRFEIQPKADRANLLLSGRFDLGGDLEGFAEVLYSKTKTSYQNAFDIYDSTASDSIWGNPSTGGSNTYSTLYLPPTHPLNTSGDYLPLRYRFLDDPASRVSDSSQYRALAGLKGSWHDYDWETAAGIMGSKSTDRSRSMSLSGAITEIGDFRTDDPNFFNHGYKIGGQNSAEVINTLFPENGYDGKITQQFIDAKMSGEVGKFNGNAVNIAVGADLRHEKFNINPTANLIAGDIISNGASTANAARTNWALFAEGSTTVVKGFEVTAAGRVDKFPGFKAHLSPKLAARWEVSPALMFRATVETGFRAPNLTESATSTKYAYDNGVVDPKRCSQAQALAADLRNQSDALPDSDPNKSVLSARADIVEQRECAAGVASTVRNNPNLKPETSRSTTLGFVAEPVKGWSASLDYWRIERKDEIGLKSTDDLLASEADQPAGVVNRLPLAQDPTFSAAERTQYGVTVGPLQSTSGMFLNVSKTKTSGFDFGATGHFNTGIGKVTLSSNATYLLDLEYFSTTRNAYGDNLAGRYGYSKLNADLSTTLQTGSFTNGLRATFSSQQSLNGDFFDDTYTLEGCQAKNWGPKQCRVASYVRWDYNFSYTGIPNVTISALVRNVFNHYEPVDLRAMNSDGGGVIPQDVSDVKGRMLRVTLDYKFR